MNTSLTAPHSVRARTETSSVCPSGRSPRHSRWKVQTLCTSAMNARVSVLPVARSLEHDGRCCVFRLEDDSVHRFDTVYPVLGCNAQSQLATALGASVDENGELHVDERQQTTVDGLYAIGDIVSALNQISVAVGHAAIAATAVHNRLPRNFREDPDAQPATAADLPSP